MNEIVERLHNAFEKYRRCKYSESDFHLTLNSIESSITENEFYELKDFLISTESSFEYVDFMIEKEYRRDEYLKIINKVEEFLDNFVSPLCS